MTVTLRCVAALAMVALAAAPARAEDPYEVPAVIALTGQGSFLGLQQRTALQLMEKIVNAGGGIHGRPLHFEIADDQSSPQVAVQLAAAIVAEKAPVMLGSSLVASCNAIASLLADGPVMYCFSSAFDPAPGSYAFAASSSSITHAEVMIRYLQLRGLTKLAVLTTTDATGLDAERSFATLLAKPEYKNVTIVAKERFNVSDVSISAQIAHLVAAHPQAVMVEATGSAAATAFRGLKQAGVDLPTTTLGGNMTRAQMTQFAAFLPSELYFENPEWPAYGDKRVALDPRVTAKQKELYTAYQAAGIKLDAAAVVPWDPIMIVIDALRALPADTSAAAVRDRLAHLKDAPGIMGIYDFVANPQRGLSLDDLLVTRWVPQADDWQVVSKPSGIPLER